MILLESTIPFDLWSYLVQQVPVVVVLGVFCWFLYKLILKRDATIKEKDILLERDRAEMMSLYGEAIKAQNKTAETLNRSNDIQLQLMELIKDVRDDIQDLRELTYKQKLD